MDETPDVMADEKNEADDVTNNPEANEVDDTTAVSATTRCLERHAERAAQRAAYIATLRETVREAEARAQSDKPDKPEEVTERTGSGSA